MVNSSSGNDLKHFKYTISKNHNIQTQRHKEDNQRPLRIDLCLFDRVG